jgi:hypothetical protein
MMLFSPLHNYPLPIANYQFLSNYFFHSKVCGSLDPLSFS